MAFKLTDEFDQPIDLTVKIIDEQGDMVSLANTTKHGLGKFKMTPQKSQEYWFVCQFKGDLLKIALPAALSEGGKMSINALHAKKITLELNASPNLSLVVCQVIGHVRGMVFLDFHIEEESKTRLIIERGKVPSGVLHFTLFDPSRRPIAERLVFNKKVISGMRADALYGVPLAICW